MIDVRTELITIRGFSLEQSGFFGVYGWCGSHHGGEVPDQRSIASG
jgi:hypothetical protein